jgi:beta/gamma crystallin
MKKIAKRAIQAALTTFALTASLTVVTATDAFAINEVPCGPSDYLQVTVHLGGTWDSDRCYANGGEFTFGVSDYWITRISTGNNRVQWYGDGRWQPDTPIDKWTVFVWPNHPGGVRIDKLRIV